MSDETVVRRAHLHWIVYLPALVVAAIAIIGGGWLSTRGTDARLAAEIIGGALGIYALCLAFSGFLKRSSARFAVTNKRVLIAIGLIRRRSVEILLSQIEGITVSQGFWGRIFNYGTVVIEGTGGDGVPYPQIARPGAFRLAVQEQIEGAQQNRTYATPDPADKPGNRYDALIKLNQLKAQGIVTEAEFQREKRNLLNNP